MDRTGKNGDRPIRVCFVMVGSYPLFNPDCTKTFGGAEVECFLLATELAKDPEFEVSFIAADEGQPGEEIRQGVRILKSVKTQKNGMFWIMPLWRALQKADADIYFRQMSSLVTVLTALFCKIKNRIFIFRTAHERECNGTYLRTHILRGKAYVWALQQAKWITAQNYIDADHLQSTTGVSSTVIRNAHPLPPLPQNGRNFILWVGRNIDFKQPHRFLELAKQLPEEKFLMICQKTGLDQDYNHLIQQAQEIPNLTFLPRVSFHEIGRYFQQAKFFVCTSDAEGFPNTYIQACIGGAAILSYKVNPDHFITRYRCGLCADGNWTTYLEHLHLLLKPQIAQQYGNAGRKYVEENHDLRKIIEQYKAAFRNLTNIRKK